MSEWIHARPNPGQPECLPEFRLFGVLGSWMEADIVGATVRNAFCQGCERVYLVDNGSSDDTVAAATSHGAILARSFATPRYDEVLRLQHMNAVAAEVSGAVPDAYVWWLFMDADEFARGPWGLSILHYLRTLDRQFRVVGARYFNHFPSGPPQYLDDCHPIDVQPLCEELSYPMCPSHHRKHPLLRHDRGGAAIAAGRGFHLAHSEELLYEPAQPIFIHHFPFRDEALTRRRLEALCAAGAAGAPRAVEGDDAGDHMRPRFRSLDAVYAGDWRAVENFIPGAPRHGVSLQPWMALVGPEHHRLERWSSPMGAWTYDRPPFAYGDDTTYARGIEFLDGHGAIEDWGCGFARARAFVKRSVYAGVDGSSPHADTTADLRSYRSEADCIFMRHVLEHNVEWPRILAGAVASFRRRMVLVVFTPFVDHTRIIGIGRHCTSVAVPDIAFRKSDLTTHFEHLRYTEESLETRTQYGAEHVFYIER